MSNINKNPLVSLIVPVYNAGAFLDKTVQSVMNQKYLDWEMILIDDFSNDNSRIMCENYSMHDKRIKTIALDDNYGPGTARNAGILISRGDFLFFLDSDDEMEDESLSVLAEYLAGHAEADVIHVNFSRWFGSILVKRQVVNLASTENVLPTDTFLHLASVNSNPGYTLWRFLFKRVFIAKHELTFSSEKIGEDLLFIFQALLRAGFVHLNNNAIYKYNIRLEWSLSSAVGHIDNWDSLIKRRAVNLLALIFYYQPSYALRQAILKHAQMLLAQFEEIILAVKYDTLFENESLFISLDKYLMFILDSELSSEILISMKKEGASKALQMVYGENKDRLFQKLLLHKNKNIYLMPATRRCSLLGHVLKKITTMWMAF